jgi:RNA polymerase sigma-70 factor (ECF subfamily)
MGRVVSATGPDPTDQRHALVALYDSALPEVYGYLASRCGSVATAEDLTSETFLAAADAVTRGRVPNLTVAWLIAVARHKMVDHWRRQGRESVALGAAADHLDGDRGVDDWEARLDSILARQVLADLGGHHRAALTLRYVDGLPVKEVAGHLDRTVGATEVLLVRARAAFRARYEAATARDEEDR